MNSRTSTEKQGRHAKKLSVFFVFLVFVVVLANGSVVSSVNKNYKPSVTSCEEKII
jgi:hypothetical protein